MKKPAQFETEPEPMIVELIACTGNSCGIGIGFCLLAVSDVAGAYIATTRATSREQPNRKTQALAR